MSIRGWRSLLFCEFGFLYLIVFFCERGVGEMRRVEGLMGAFGRVKKRGIGTNAIDL